MTSIENHDDEILDAARRALGGGSGTDALCALGFWELLPDLGDAKVRAAVFALFRAQGRELASSAALGALAAQPFLEAAGAAPGGFALTFTRRSARRGLVTVVAGANAPGYLLRASRMRLFSASRSVWEN